MWSVPDSQERCGAGVFITLLFHVSVQGLHLNWEPQSVSTRLEDIQGQELGSAVLLCKNITPLNCLLHHPTIRPD